VQDSELIVSLDDLILVTGSTGFIGSRVVENLLERGFRNVRCFIRSSGDSSKLEKLASQRSDGASLEVVRGNLLSRDDCTLATKNIRVIYHLAASTGEKSFPDAFMNSVITTRNLLDATLEHGALRRFVNVSSFAVYSNRSKPHGQILDESAPVEERPERRGEAYCFAKLKQDELVMDYSTRHGIPYVLLRPGVVYGPGKNAITGRVGRDTFGFFLHLGGPNQIPFTYVDNCAEAIVLAGLIKGVDGEVFNIVDDDLPSSRSFLRSYKREVKRFPSVYFPRPVSHFACYLWEKYSAWSGGQLPPVFNRLAWHAYWKGSQYTNEKLKARLGWRPRVTTSEGLTRFFESCRGQTLHA
jgi:nucleoside-diphosphate-sugar epimerase